MRLIDDARQIWYRLWSLRLALLSAALNAGLVVATMALPAHTSVRVASAVGVLAFASAVASAAARIVKQPGAAVAAAVDAAVSRSESDGSKP